MLTELRPRALHLLLGVALMLVLAPTAAPGALTERLARGAAALSGARGPAALAELEAALGLAPESVDLRWAVAQAAWMSGQPERAQVLLSALRAEGSLPDGAACLEAEIRLWNGDLARGMELLDGTHPACPAQPQLLRRLSERLLDQQSWGPAEQVLRRLVERAPDSAWGHAQLGTLIATHDAAGALDHLRLAAQLDPAGAREAQQLSRSIEAGLALGAAPLGLAQAGQALAAAGRWQLARSALESAVALDPASAGAQALLALAIDQTGGDGSEQLQIAIDLAPESPQVQVLAGRHWRSLGRQDLALAALETAARLDPADPVVASELGSLYLERGELRSAEAAYLHAVSVAPENPLFWGLLARFSLEQEHNVRSQGLPAARRALQLAPDDPQALDMLAACHYLLGEFHLAERLLWRALQADPQLASAQYHRGLVLLALGDLNGAVFALQQAQLLDPDGRIGDLAGRSLANLPR